MSTIIKHKEFANHKVYKTQVAGRPLTIDVGKVAELASASALVTYGETTVLVAVTALIPVFGAFIGCFLGAFFILVQNPIQAVWFVVLFLCIQQIEGNLIYPKVVGNSVGLPGIWVLMAVTIGGNAMGVVGMLVMIPACSVIYSLLRTATRRKLREKGVDREKYLPEAPKAK